MFSDDLSQDYLIDKYLIPRLKLRCPVHNKEKALMICTDNSCKKYCVVCKSCQIDSADHFKEHKVSFKTLDAYIQEVSVDIETMAKSNKLALQEVYSATPNLQKWQDDDEEHLRKVENHCLAQKAMIDEDMSLLGQLVMLKIESIREKIHSKLDKFYFSYCEKFNQQKRDLNEHFGLARNFHLYANPYNLAAKLHSEMPQQASEFLSQLNRSLDKAKQIYQNKQSFINSFRQINIQLSKMTEKLPNYVQADTISESLIFAIGQQVEGYFQKNIVIPDDNQESNNNYVQQLQIIPAVSSAGIFPSSSSSNNGLLPFAIPPTISPISNNNQSNNNNTNYVSNNIINNNWQGQKSSGKKQIAISKSGKKMKIYNTDQYVSIKPVKKYQLDTPICSVTALSDTQFAIASVGDGKVKLFNSFSKTMSSYPAHSAPITFLTKIRALFVGDQVNSAPKCDDLSNGSSKYSGKILIASASADLTVLLLQYDCQKLQLPFQYTKLSGFTATPQCILDMQDGLHIATGDSLGEVQIWNYHESRQIQVIRSRHQGKIIGVFLMKNEKKLVIVSEDSISIQRFFYAQLPVSPLVGQIERIIQDQFISNDASIGKISSFLMAYREGICFIGNNDGDILIYDLQAKRSIQKWNAHRGPVIDLCIIEFVNNNDLGTIISLGLSDKQVKIWRINSSDEHQFAQFKMQDPMILEGNSANDDISSKNKIQIVPANAQSSPKIVITNERDKEILVYSIF